MRPSAPSRLADRVIGAAALLTAAAFAAWVISVAKIDISTITFLHFILVWVCLPYFALAAGAFVLSRCWFSRGLLALGVVASALFGLWVYGAIDEDAQGALLLLFVPLYQLAGALIVIGLVAAVEFFILASRP